MCHFLLRRDLDGAQKLISSCKRFPDTTWRYSAAFLAAYSGDLQTAWSHYQKAFANPPSDPSVPNQCESFIKGILEIEPHQYQLWYCLGLINFRAKNDLEAARNDFRVFLQHTEKSKFSPQEKIAAKYIRKIESELKTNRIAA
jgi:tetratricopeptide (TPR) repeat protein